MHFNIGNVDRILRVVVGALLLSLLLVDGNARWFGLVGLVPLATGLIGMCPLYTVFRFNTHPKPQPKM